MKLKILSIGMDKVRVILTSGLLCDPQELLIFEQKFHLEIASWYAENNKNDESTTLMILHSWLLNPMG
jgi:hypothetical protein